MFYTIHMKQLKRSAAVIFLLAATLFLTRAALMHDAVETAAVGKGRCLVIDPGHGGIDGGAIGANGVKESDVNLSIALKLQHLADLAGVPTVMTRSDDSSRTDILSYSEHEDLVHRTSIINAIPNAVLISIHQNFYPTSEPYGAQVLYAAGEDSRRLGQLTHDNIVRLLQPQNRRLAEQASKNLYITANASCPAILVECGFLSNYNEMEKLCSDSYQTSLAAVLLASYLQFAPGQNFL